MAAVGLVWLQAARSPALLWGVFLPGRLLLVQQVPLSAGSACSTPAVHCSVPRQRAASTRMLLEGTQHIPALQPLLQ